MTVSDKELARLGGWPAGINNRHRETELGRNDNGAIDALRAAVNVDLTAQGTPISREGYRKVVTCTNCHSIWRDGLFPFALFVDEGTLYGMEVGGNPFAIRSGLAPRAISYAHVAGKAYWSNGVESGVVLHDGTAMAWGVPSPAGQPAVAAVDSGDTRWQVAITYKRSDGEESGTGEAALCVGDTESLLDLSLIPQPADLDVVAIRIYVSPPNGDDLYYCREIPVGMASVQIDPRRRSKLLETQFLDPLPPGDFVRALNGRLYVATGDTLYWSEALRYGLGSLSKNRIRIGGGVTLLQAVGDGTDGAGLFAADGKRTYWFGGTDPARFSRAIAAGEAAFKGTGLSVPGNLFALETTVPVAYWLNTQGVACVGLPGGSVLPLRERTAVAPLGEMGASLLREQDGVTRIITALRSSTKNPLAVSDRASARVYRNGVEVA